MRHYTFLLVLAATLFSGTLRAQVPQLVNYQGRVAVDAVNFEGAGQFKFALVNSDGTTTFWSNDGTSAGGSEPAAAVTLTVSKGLYSLLLGDTALGNMTAIPPGVFTDPDVRLRVWFNDGANGSQLLTPDQRLAPAAYLADGTVTSASISDAAITAGKIGPGAVNGTNIAPASLDSTSFAVPGPPSDGQVLGYNNGSLTWTAPGGGVFSLNGTNAYYNGGSVGLGTSSPQAGYRLDVIGATRLAPGGSGGAIQFGTPGGETGMTILGANNRADIRFDNFSLKLVTGAGTGLPSSLNGITITTPFSNVGIGTTNPNARLDVRGQIIAAGGFRVDEFQSGNRLFELIDWSQVSRPNELHMYGDAYKTAGGTSWIFSSDRRLKQDVRAYEPGLNEVLQLRPVRFRYRDGLKPGLTSAQEEVGFIAQDVREVIPDAVTEGKDGYLMLKADPIHWAAINAIQELNAKLEEQRAENAGLKQRLEKLEQRMNEKNGGAE